MQPAALLIDGMGTLVSLADPIPRLVASLRDRLGAAVSPRRAGAALAAEIAYYRAHMLQGADADSLADLRRDCARTLAAALGPPVDAADPEAVLAALLDALSFAPSPDARELLARVRATTPGARIVVVSNWDVSLADALETAGLAPLLDAVVTSAAVGVAKPDPAIFEHALALAGVAPEQAVHVGDSLAEDVAGARAAGVAAVLLRRDADGEPPPAGVPVIASLADLPWPWPYPRTP